MKVCPPLPLTARNQCIHKGCTWPNPGPWFSGASVGRENINTGREGRWGERAEAGRLETRDLTSEKGGGGQGCV